MHPKLTLAVIIKYFPCSTLWSTSWFTHRQYHHHPHWNQPPHCSHQWLVYISPTIIYCRSLSVGQPSRDLVNRFPEHFPDIHLPKNITSARCRRPRLFRSTSHSATHFFISLQIPVSHFLAMRRHASFLPIICPCFFFFYGVFLSSMWWKAILETPLLLFIKTFH